MKFARVADVFAKVESESGRTLITGYLAELFQEAFPEEIGHIINFCLGQLNPPYIGTQFNIAEKNIMKAISLLTGIPETELTIQLKSVGDLGSVVEQQKWKQETSLSVTEVYDALFQLESLKGTGSQEDKVHALERLLRRLDPQSAKYVVRIILSKLRLGVSDMTLIDALSWMLVGNKTYKATIEDAYNICVDLGLIATKIKHKGVESLADMHIQLGIPIRPAAAERMQNSEEIFQKLGFCVAEPKIDGFRLQIHVDRTQSKPQIRFFSRNLIDMSHMFPDLTEAAAQLPVSNAILEGEAIVYDPNTGTYLPFQETVKRKRKHGVEEAAEEMPLRVFLFNILYLDGENLLDKTQEERRILLENIFVGFSNPALSVIQEYKMNSAADIERYFNDAIEHGLEGIMVKRTDSIYQPGKRNFNWIKYKRSSAGHLQDTVDAVILGYYAGEGKRSSFGIGAFLVGILNEKHDQFETVAKIGTGLSDVQWKELKEKCDAQKAEHQPNNVIVAKELAPDVWTYPEIVCVIKADEITRSPLHTAGKTTEHPGLALRFPRFLHYRDDKNASDATTVKELQRMFAVQLSQMNKE